MTEELKALIKNFNEKLHDAQCARNKIMEYLEEHYDIDENSVAFEDNLIWCFGINVDEIEKSITLNDAL